MQLILNTKPSILNATLAVLISATATSAIAVNCDTASQANSRTAQCQAFANPLAEGLRLKKLGRGIPDKDGLNNYGKALKSFSQAYVAARSRQQMAEALAHYGDTLRLQKRYPEALSYLTKARRLFNPIPGWVNLLALGLEEQLAQKPLDKARLLRGLARVPSDGGLLLDTSSHGMAKQALRDSVNIRLHFASNSTQLSADSENNLKALAEALQVETLRPYQFVLVGHTDKRGKNAYNLSLSKARALAIQNKILQQYPELKQRIAIEGHGESELLYQGESENIHKLNRRLEVVLKQR